MVFPITPTHTLSSLTCLCPRFILPENPEKDFSLTSEFCLETSYTQIVPWVLSVVGPGPVSLSKKTEILVSKEAATAELWYYYNVR